MEYRWLLNALFLILLFCFPILHEYWCHKKSSKTKFWNAFWSKYGFSKFKMSYLLWGFLLSLGLFALNILIVYLASYFPINDLPDLSTSLVKEFLLAPILYSVFLLISAIAEEFFFRVYLTSYLGIWLATIVFALLHFSYNSYIEIIGAFILGLILAIVWKKTKNFYIVAVGHFLQNLYAILLLVYFLT